MPYLVDGHNLIGTWPGLRVGDRRAEEHLRIVLARFLRRRRVKGVLVFDGDPPDGEARRERDLGPLRVVYAGPGAGAADRRILRRVEELERPREWTVVTSDRALGQACRSRGARWVRSAELRGEMEALLASGERGSEDSPALRPHEVEDWLAWFEREGGESSDGEES